MPERFFFSCFPDKEVPTVTFSTHSPVVTLASTKEPLPGVQSSGGLAVGLPQSAPTAKGQPSVQKGDWRILPTALPQNLLPLLGRGLSVSSLPGSHSLGHQSGGLLKRVKAQPAAMTSVAALDTGGDPAEPQPSDTHSGAPDINTHTAEQQQKTGKEADEELTTVDTVLGTATETGSSPPGNCQELAFVYWATPPHTHTHTLPNSTTAKFHCLQDCTALDTVVWPEVQQKILPSGGLPHFLMCTFFSFSFPFNFARHSNRLFVLNFNIFCMSFACHTHTHIVWCVV